MQQTLVQKSSDSLINFRALRCVANCTPNLLEGGAPGRALRIFVASCAQNGKRNRTQVASWQTLRRPVANWKINSGQLNAYTPSFCCSEEGHSWLPSTLYKQRAFSGDDVESAATPQRAPSPSKSAQPNLKRSKPQSSPAKGYKFRCVCSVRLVHVSM